MSEAWRLLATRPAGTVSSLAVAGDVVVAATPAGLRRSRDGGRSWTGLGPALVPPMEVAVPAPSFATDGLVLTGTAHGLHRSIDGGHTWTPVLVGSRVLAIAFATDQIVLVGTEQDGTLRSDDAGRTWRSANPGLLDLTVPGLACSSRFEVDPTAYAATASGLFRTRNGGRAWRSVDTLPGDPALQCVVASGASVLVGTEADGLLRSSDGGATWARADALAERSVTAVAWSQARIAAATDAGVALSVDAGETWRWVGSEIGPVLSVAFANDGAVLAALPRQGVIRSEDGVRWEASNDDLRANLAVGLAAASDRRLYLAGLEDGIAVSSDGGVTWQPCVPGEDNPVFGLSPDAVYAATAQGVLKRGPSRWDVVTESAARAVRCHGERVLALGVDGGVAVSEDGGGLWRAATWPAQAGAPTCLDLTSDGTLLVGAHTGVWRATAEGEWQRILDAGGVSAVLGAPTYAVDGRLFVGVGREVWTPARGVEEVVRRERRPVWRRASTSGDVSALATSPAYHRDHTVLAATSAGVCISRDAGGSFMPLTDGAGETPIVAVAFSPAFATDCLVYALELGGRIWCRHLS